MDLTNLCLNDKLIFCNDIDFLVQINRKILLNSEIIYMTGELIW